MEQNGVGSTVSVSGTGKGVAKGVSLTGDSRNTHICIERVHIYSENESS